MTRDELNNLYFKWLCQLVQDRRYSEGKSYQKLLSKLHNTIFDYGISLDENRAEDGIDLRYRFGQLELYEEPMIATFLDDRPCSIFEMLIALSIQCQKIMDEPNLENQIGHWFWNMIENLKLLNMSDLYFDEEYVDERIFIFLNREYTRNGEGGLFTIRHSQHDMRTAEIWYQMCWYLDDILNE